MIYPTIKNDVYHFDEIWSLNVLDFEDYGPENNRIYIYVLVVFDKFLKFGRTVPLTKKMLKQ